ncbi:hypothetical protein [Streptomyces syringium]|uniref:hypothetical protein n=1 Tax=Streptomyces syringium TaxID=76729 RepID=UPI0037D67354
MTAQPAWTIRPSSSTAFPFEWQCTATLTTWLRSGPCPAGGLARTEAAARRGAEQHAATAHPTDGQDGAER